MPFVSLIEKIFFSNFHGWGSLNNSVFSQGPVWFMKTGIASADLNMAWSEKPLTADEAEVVGRVKDEYLRWGLPFWWWVFPSARPGHTQDILLAAGLDLIKSLPCMLADLSSLPEEPARAVPLNVLCVSNERELDLWEAVSFSGFEFTPDTKQQFHRFVRSFGLSENSSYKLLLGLLGKTAVATSLLFMQEDACGIYFLTTLADKRKKGIGLAMTQAVMREAKKYGARFAVLQSSPDGYRVYRRAGFEQQCQVEVYGLQGA